MIIYLQQIWKQKEACSQSPWSFCVYLVPFSSTCLLKWKFFRLKTVSLCICILLPRYKAPREMLYFQLTVLRSSWYHPATMSWLKRLQNCGRTVLQLPMATHLHSADHHWEGHLLIPSTDHHVSQRQELQQQVRYKLNTDLTDLLTARTLE